MISAAARRRDPRAGGFTLIELMFVITIIAILAFIAIPKFADLVRKAKEGATKNSLGTIRSALDIYYADMEGQYPNNITALTRKGKFLAVIPLAETPFYHADDSAVALGAGECLNTKTGVRTGQAQAACLAAKNRAWVSVKVTDTGGWTFTNDPTAGNWGSLQVNCLHTDTRGKGWSSY